MVDSKSLELHRRADVPVEVTAGPLPKLLKSTFTAGKVEPTVDLKSILGRGHWPQFSAQSSQ
eukprot:15323290-Alexandrium_andersonii.AAC.1